MRIVLKLYGIAIIGLLSMACSSVEEETVMTHKPALTVSLIKPLWSRLPEKLLANGSIAAWDEATISSEINGLQLQSVQFEVGQKVTKGQLLATFDAAAVAADFQQAHANLALAEANAEEATLNANRARQSQERSVMSAQQIAHYLAEEKIAKARQAAARATLEAQQVRLHNTRVHAIDDGVISARSATIGGVYNAGQELGRLIRQQRLEWRAEINASEINQLQVGMPVRIQVAGLGAADGQIRMLSPVLDITTRKALVYVDLPDAMAHGFRSGMFAQGEFTYGALEAWLVPQNAVLFKDGFHVLFVVDIDADGRAQVRQLKVEIGDIVGDQIVIRAGLKPEQAVVASGVAFLTDGDWVKVVQP